MNLGNEVLNTISHRGKPLRTGLPPALRDFPLSRSGPCPPLHYAPQLRSVPDSVLHYAVRCASFRSRHRPPLGGRPLLRPPLRCTRTSSSVVAGKVGADGASVRPNAQRAPGLHLSRSRHRRRASRSALTRVRCAITYADVRGPAPAPSARCPWHHGGCACAPLSPSCPRCYPFLCQNETYGGV